MFYLVLAIICLVLNAPTWAVIVCGVLGVLSLFGPVLTFNVTITKSKDS